MTNWETLKDGMQHIAENHHFKAHLEEMDMTGEVWIEGNNIPTLADVQMLMEDLKMPRYAIAVADTYIDIGVPYDWYMEHGQEEFQGLRLWEKADRQKGLKL